MITTKCEVSTLERVKKISYQRCIKEHGHKVEDPRHQVEVARNRGPRDTCGARGRYKQEEDRMELLRERSGYGQPLVERDEQDHVMGEADSPEEKG